MSRLQLVLTPPTAGSTTISFSAMTEIRSACRILMPTKYIVHSLSFRTFLNPYLQKELLLNKGSPICWRSVYERARTCSLIHRTPTNSCQGLTTLDYISEKKYFQHQKTPDIFICKISHCVQWTYRVNLMPTRAVPDLSRRYPTEWAICCHLNYDTFARCVAFSPQSAWTCSPAEIPVYVYKRYTHQHTRRPAHTQNTHAHTHTHIRTNTLTYTHACTRTHTHTTHAWTDSGMILHILHTFSKSLAYFLDRAM